MVTPSKLKSAKQVDFFESFNNPICISYSKLQKKINLLESFKISKTANLYSTMQNIDCITSILYVGDEQTCQRYPF